MFCSVNLLKSATKSRAPQTNLHNLNFNHRTRTDIFTLLKRNASQSGIRKRATKPLQYRPSKHPPRNSQSIEEPIPIHSPSASSSHPYFAPQSLSEPCDLVEIPPNATPIDFCTYSSSRLCFPRHSLPQKSSCPNSQSKGGPRDCEFRPSQV